MNREWLAILLLTVMVGGCASTSTGSPPPASITSVPAATAGQTAAPPEHSVSPEPISTPIAISGGACDALSVAEITSATNSPWTVVAEPGQYLDGDPRCRYLTPGHTLVSVAGDPVPLVEIEWLTAPGMVSYWTSKTVHATPVAVDGAKAWWAEGDSTLIVVKGGQTVVLAPYPGLDPANSGGLAIPAGGLRAIATKLAQPLADHIP